MPTAIAIVSGEPAVGRVLGRLVEAAGYTARHLPDRALSSPATLATSLSGVGGILLSPALDPRRRESLRRTLEGPAVGREVPLLELPWPCGTKELARAIEKTVPPRTLPTEHG